MNFPNNEWVVLAEYEPYRNVYEIRVFLNTSPRMVMVPGDPVTVRKHPEGTELTMFTTVTAEAWDDLSLGSLFKNVYVRSTTWTKL